MKFKPGDFITPIHDNPSGLAVFRGEIGVILDYPQARQYLPYNFVAVKFEVGRDIKGRYGREIGLVHIADVKRIYNDDEMFEDVK